MKAFLQTLLRLLYRVKIQGALPAKLPARTVFIANHQSFLDGLLLSLVVPANALFIVHTTVLHSWLFRQVLRMVPHLAIDTSSPLALKGVLRLIEQGQPLVIFPEGRITLTGNLMKVYEGAAFLAARAGATIFDITIRGALYSNLSRIGHLLRTRPFPAISLTVHPGVAIAMPTTGSAREKRKVVAESVRQLMMAHQVQATPQSSIFEAFLDAVDTHGRDRHIAEDVRFEYNPQLGKEEPVVKKETYGSLLRMALGVRQLMRSRSHIGERIGVLLPNTTGAAAAILGLLAGGRVPAMLNYSTGVENLKSSIVAAQINVVLTSRAFIERGKLHHLLAGLSDVQVLYAEDLKKSMTVLDRLSVLVSLLFPRSTMVSCPPESPAIVLFTSGSESRPKGVVHTHQSLLANIAQVRAMADFTPNDKFLAALPIFHSFGLTASTLLPLVTGVPVFFYVNPLHYRVVPDLVYDARCTVIFGTSTFLSGYGRFGHPYDFAHVRYVVAGAEKLQASVRQLWYEKFGLRILEGYGATECAPVISVNTPFAFKLNTVGKLVPCMAYALEQAEGITVGGLLHVSGPNLMAGYLRYENPGVIEPPSSSMGPGWYCTGDVVSIDAQGFLAIQGRIKRFAKIGGEMVALEAVEKMVATLYPAGQHAVVTRPDPVKGEQLVLFTNVPTLSRDQLIAAARATGLTELYVPRRIVAIEKLPMLGALKVDYVALKKMAEQGT